jgi:hypothetical protein
VPKALKESVVGADTYVGYLPVGDFVGAFLNGYRAVTLLTVLVGLVLWAFSAAKNAIDYTEVVAQVERVEHVCRPAGTPMEASTDCASAAAVAGNKKLIRHLAVHVRYRSPADDQEHSGVIIPIGGKNAVQANRLRPGDRWKILAHDDVPDAIKLE